MIGLDTIWMGLGKGVSTAAADPSDTKPAGAPPQALGQPTDQGVPMTDIHDIKPILDMGLDWQWLLMLAGGLALALALAALAWWYWRRRRKKDMRPPAPQPLVPDVEAYQALDVLDAQDGLDPKQFYFRLSAVLRRYIERRFHFPAAEMTTEELLPKVDRLPLDGTLTGALKALCRQTDPIKFAGASVRPEQMAQDLAFTRDFVRQTTVAVQQQDDDTPPADKPAAALGAEVNVR